MTLALNLTGHRFGRLTAIERRGNSAAGKAIWRCQCDCGNETLVVSGNLKSGLSKSCGCYSQERAAARAAIRNRTHGDTAGGKLSPEYRSWAAMHGRCRYPGTNDFKHYGGRGITVCERWSSFEAFLADMGRKPTPQHSIDRIDVNGNYEPSNCRWATPTEQARNKRRRQ